MRRCCWTVATATAMADALMTAAAIAAATVAKTAAAMVAACGSNNCIAAAAMTAEMVALNGDADFV